MNIQAVACCPVLDAPLSDADAERTARRFKALADPTRVKLLSLIASSPEGEMCVCNLTAPVGLSQPTVSHHLKVLTDAGFLERERRQSWAYFRVRRDTLESISEILRPGESEGMWREPSPNLGS